MCVHWHKQTFLIWTCSTTQNWMMPYKNNGRKKQLKITQNIHGTIATRRKKLPNLYEFFFLAIFKFAHSLENSFELCKSSLIFNYSEIIEMKMSQFQQQHLSICWINIPIFGHWTLILWAYFVILSYEQVLIRTNQEWT